jgi:hypothetical protein
VTKRLPIHFSNDGRVHLQSWENCRNNADVGLLLIEGWGHVWPGPYSTSDLARTNPLRNFDAAKIIQEITVNPGDTMTFEWDFSTQESRHSNPPLDFAFVSVVCPGETHLQELADAGLSTLHSAPLFGASTDGSYLDLGCDHTGYHSFSIKLTSGEACRHGVLDSNDQCLDTRAGAQVDKFGCSLSQFCSNIGISGKMSYLTCIFADWQDDEFLFPRDCKVANGICQAR